MKKSTHLAKDQYWEKWQLKKLLENLETANRFLKGRTGGYSGIFTDIREFSDALKEEIYQLRTTNQHNPNQLWIWFAPTSQWDDFAGCEGKELGNQIFEILDPWKKACDAGEDIIS